MNSIPSRFRVLSKTAALCFFVFTPLSVLQHAAFAAEPAWWTEQKRACGLPSGLAYNSWDGTCGSSSGGSGGQDSSWQIEQQRLEAERLEAERKRREAENERQRREAEEKRVREQKERDARFIRERDATVLRGSADTVFKPGAALDPVSDIRLNERREQAARDLGGNAAAWKQLSCAASVFAVGLEAAIRNSDYQEFKDLSSEASKALSGERMGVVCDTGPIPVTLKDVSSQTMESVKQVQGQVLEKAKQVVDRMEQRDASLPKEARETLRSTLKETPFGPETGEERIKRIQRALNRINEVKVDGQTIEMIREQEKDRQEAARLLLIAEKIRDGQFTDESVNLTEEKETRRSTGMPSPVKPRETQKR